MHLSAMDNQSLIRRESWEDPCILQNFVGVDPGFDSVIMTLPSKFPRLINRQERGPCSSHTPVQVSPSSPVKDFMFSTVFLNNPTPCLPFVL